MLTESERRLILEIQEDIPLTGRPYLEIADRVGLTEREVMSKIEKLLNEGLIRRFGAFVSHRRLGFEANAMVVWRVPEHRVAQVGKALAGFEEVSHCYERPPQEDWPYNLFTMVHGRTPRECEDTARRLSSSVGIKDYLLLFSTDELKKTSMRYFSG